MIPFDLTQLTNIRPAAPPEGPLSRLPESARPFEDYLTSAGRDSSARRVPDSQPRPAAADRSSAESPPLARSAPEAGAPDRQPTETSDRKPDSDEAGPAVAERPPERQGHEEPSSGDEPSAAPSLSADGADIEEHPGDAVASRESVPSVESEPQETGSGDPAAAHSETAPGEEEPAAEPESAASAAVTTAPQQAAESPAPRQPAAQGVAQAEAVQAAFKPAVVAPAGSGETAVPADDAEAADSERAAEAKQSAAPHRPAESRAGEGKPAGIAAVESPRKTRDAERIAGSPQGNEKPPRDEAASAGRGRRSASETGRDVRRQSAASPVQAPSSAQTGESSAAGEESPAAPVAAGRIVAESLAGEARDPSARPAASGESARGAESSPSGVGSRETPLPAAGNRAPASLLPPAGGSETDSTAQSPQERVRFVQRVARAFEAAQQRGGEIRLRLSPPELGRMRLEISVRQGVLVARLETETPEARQVLLDNLPQLRERLAEQSIKVERFDVDLRDQSRGDSAESRSEQARRQAAERANRLPRPESESAPDAPPSGPAAGSDQLNVVI